MRSSFVSALSEEIRLRSQPSLKVDTLYLGGGTPSTLTCEEIERIMKAVRENFSIMDDTQITMEVNPGTITDRGRAEILDTETDKTDWLRTLHTSSCHDISPDHYLSTIHTIGVNRLSIGVQSFNDKKLKFLKRVHSADAARQTIAAARSAGFQDIGVDLIYGLPEESETIWLNDLEAALQYHPEHISCYTLSYEPDTPMFTSYKKGKIIPLDDQITSSLFRLTSGYLLSKGFSHYEISNFAAKPENQSRHNKKYWEMAPYLGFGPSAHSYDGAEERSWNVKSVDRYISTLARNRLPLMERELLTNGQRVMEMIMLRLRTDQGVDIASFERLSGSKFNIMFQTVLERVENMGWGKLSPGESFSLTLDGRLFLDTIIRWFVEAMEI